MKIRIKKSDMLNIINAGISKGINGIEIKNGKVESFSLVSDAWPSDAEYELIIKEDNYDSWNR